MYLKPSVKQGEEMVNLGNDWDELLKEEFEKDYYLNLRSFLVNEYKYKHIYPQWYCLRI